ncbi:GNAT family N-acetyltransferase [Amycolatopsis panacis]|uniref:GNAT family N-acetyltransferase n=1 Tax=Amycolatopsis panacis TaxID=2340917 RepID=A0A419I806_9PSEU|nr:GNAT family N-acetyltransferase [Amycolatopsis panacis]RJQ88203.1 GNAT family N-acetyltransferase [Amycolatopsis panacis]
MTAMSSGCSRYVRLSADEFRARLQEALAIYVQAMQYPEGTAEQRAPMWLTHALRDGWRCMAALDGNGVLLGLAYGYHGRAGQWWHEQVRQGLTRRSGREKADEWLSDYFELTEIHVRPENQGKQIGEGLLLGLLDGVEKSKVLLSTPEGTNRAWNLYRRTGFVDVLRDYHFTGDPRPFAILGRQLPLERR